jgi:hypothetical protein
MEWPLQYHTASAQLVWLLPTVFSRAAFRFEPQLMERPNVLPLGPIVRRDSYTSRHVRRSLERHFGQIRVELDR